MANGSVKIGGGSITIEFDNNFSHATDPNGNHKCEHQDKNMKITEVVITDESKQRGNAYLKINAQSLSLPKGKNIFVKVRYEAAAQSATAGRPR